MCAIKIHVLLTYLLTYLSIQLHEKKVRRALTQLSSWQQLECVRFPSPFPFSQG